MYPVCTSLSFRRALSRTLNYNPRQQRSTIHVYVCAYNYVHAICFKMSSSNFTFHCIINPEHTLCAKPDIVTFKFHLGIFLILGTLSYMISSQDGTVEEGCDSTVSYAQEQVCYLSHCI